MYKFSNIISSKRRWPYFILGILCITGIIICSRKTWVELYYSDGVYVLISNVLRLFFAKIPFSIGDIFYASVTIFVSFWFVKNIILIFRATNKWASIASFLKNIGKGLLLFTIWFYAVWGLNYYRVGIAGQVKLGANSFHFDDLIKEAESISQKLTVLASQKKIDGFNPMNETIFLKTVNYYKAATAKLSFLEAKNITIKASLFGFLGNYMGFQGYYNPFSGESQINATIPAVLKPFVCLHEVAHQLGYAKEDEANFVGYLVCKYGNVDDWFAYSTYLEMFLYFINEIKKTDEPLAKKYLNALPQKAKNDLKECRQFFIKYKTGFSKMLNLLYAKYLKANNQPKGMDSYSQVVGWVIAFEKKYSNNAGFEP